MLELLELAGVHEHLGEPTRAAAAGSPIRR
jgi:hypothetical protein